MSRRYTVVGEWTDDLTPTPVEVHEYELKHDAVLVAVYAVQSADIVDNVTGTRYTDGAMRVVRNGKPVVRGKGGTVPFLGESAWADARRLFDDVVFAARRAAYR